MLKKYMPQRLFMLACIMAGTMGFLSAQTVFLTVGINQPASLEADAGNDQTVCEGESIQIGGSPAATGGTMSYAYAWSPNVSLSSGTVGNPTATPTGSTAYILEVTDVNNCTSLDTVTITVSPLPAVAFSSVVDPNGLTVDFTDLTAGNNTFWQWDFGDGFLSTQQNPTHNYSQNGIYTVCLTVTNADGCLDSTCMAVNALVGMEDALPGGFSASPNPYSGATKVSFTLDHSQEVALEVFDLLGHKVATLANEELPSGQHEYGFSAKELGQPAGVYMIRLSMGEIQGTLRVIEVD